VRLLLLVYSVCTRGALRCFFNKLAITYIKKKNIVWPVYAEGSKGNIYKKKVQGK
jgi:hypothetical protein